MKNYRFIIYMLILLGVFSCTAPKNIAYMQNAPVYGKQNNNMSYQVKIQNDDLLSIYVFSKDSALAAPFNPIAPNEGVKQYLVGADGFIDFPIFGKVKAYGLSRIELAANLRNRLVNDGFIKDAIVTVKMLNFKISVMGEVAKPGVYAVPTERITILEAVSMAGDLTIYGKRDKVLIVRENDGVRDMQYVDLQSTSLFNSPYYYLHQNDVVYIEPNKSKSIQSDYNPRVPIVLSSISVAASIISLLVLIF